LFDWSIEELPRFKPKAISKVSWFGFLGNGFRFYLFWGWVESR